MEKNKITHDIPNYLKNPLSEINKSCSVVFSDVEKGKKLKGFRRCQRSLSHSCLVHLNDKEKFSQCIGNATDSLKEIQDKIKSQKVDHGGFRIKAYHDGGEKNGKD